MKRRLKKDFVPVAIMLCLLIFGFYAQAHAALMTYSDESTFLSAAPIASTEDFEGFSNGFIYSSTVVIDEVVYNATTGGNWSIPGSYGGISGTKGFGSTFGGPNEISFGNNVYLDAFGFYFISQLGYAYPWEIEVFEKGGSSTLFNVQFSSTEGAKYYGFLSDVGIEKLIVRDYDGDSNLANWSYDNVSRSSTSVPEPATMLLLGTGFVGIAGLGRKKYKK